MSNRYKGGVISATPPTTTGGESGTASGAWTLEQQMQLQAAGLWPAQPTGPWIEDCFSTYLYTSTGSNQTITNGIDLSTKGGLVWVKGRNAVKDNVLVDTLRGVSNSIVSNTTDAQDFSSGNYVNAFSTTGFGVSGIGAVGGTNNTFATWTFRKQPKFFDVVTYTGDNVIGREIPHNLGSVPGCIMVKQTNATRDWVVYHVGIGNTKYLTLNSTSPAGTQSFFNNTSPTSTNFTVGDWGAVNQAGSTYVAYLFAHNAGGFGLTGTDNVISCGSYTTNGSGVATVSLGYEPQWVLTKATSGTYGTTDWVIADNMRGMPAPPQTDGVGGLFPNLSSAEDNNFNRSVHPTSTGFVANQYNSTPYIYIAIRRGPMKVPTVGTSVFLPTARTGNAALTTVTSGFATDVVFARRRDTLDNANESVVADKLRGSGTLSTNDGAAEYNGGATSGLNAYLNTGVILGTNNSPIYAFNYDTLPYLLYQFQRAPSFFDEVCYTGTSGVQALTHNLTVVPELILCKRRSANADSWRVYSATVGNTACLILNGTHTPITSDSFWNDTSPTTTQFTTGGHFTSATNYVAYLFATCAGVSKVGSYTGTGTTLQVNCGFTGGARFVLIKRTDSTGDWYVWDSARGIVAGNDPYLLLNSTAAEVTGTDYVDTYSAGFEISSTAPAAINANGGTFIFLAIA